VPVPERVIDIFAECVRVLEDLARYRNEITADVIESQRDKRNMVLYALVEAIQGAIDLADRVRAERGMPRAETYREIFAALAQARVIDDAMAASLADLAGFRNVLVHIYFNLDLKRVHEVLTKDVRVIEDFLAIVAEYFGLPR
jgi:uncharacterized protein YutE (UPF0331/DUF86 family)